MRVSWGAAQSRRSRLPAAACNRRGQARCYRRQSPPNSGRRRRGAGTRGQTGFNYDPTWRDKQIARLEKVKRERSPRRRQLRPERAQGLYQRRRPGAHMLVVARTTLADPANDKRQGTLLSIVDPQGAGRRNATSRYAPYGTGAPVSNFLRWRAGRHENRLGADGTDSRLCSRR